MMRRMNRLGLLLLLIVVIGLMTGCRQAGPPDQAGPSDQAAPGTAVADSPREESRQPAASQPESTESQPSGSPEAVDPQLSDSSESTGTRLPGSSDSFAISPSSEEDNTSGAASSSDPGKQTVLPDSSPEEPKGTTAADSGKEPSVRLSILGDEERGAILPLTVVEIKAGDTVIDVLKRITREKKIQMEFKGRGATAYIEGIDNLYEFDKGAESGWMYRVNGEEPGIGAGSHQVKAGDLIEWLYTENLDMETGDADE